jgi:hypothetical protein
MGDSGRGNGAATADLRLLTLYALPKRIFLELVPLVGIHRW